MRALCPIMIWLSSFTPSDTTVSSSAPRSTVVLAPISTSSPRDTPPNCGILPQAPLPKAGSGAKPKPSAPSTAPLWMMALAPTFTPSYSVTLACRRLPGPMDEPAPITQPGPSTVSRPMRTPDSTTQLGPIRTPSSIVASGATTAEGCVSAGSAGRRAASNHCATRAYSK
ncbi:hypothetical protein D3C85_1467590 [compost metagenome]